YPEHGVRDVRRTTRATDLERNEDRWLDTLIAPGADDDDGSSYEFSSNRRRIKGNAPHGLGAMDRSDHWHAQPARSGFVFDSPNGDVGGNRDYRLSRRSGRNALAHWRDGDGLDARRGWCRHLVRAVLARCADSVADSDS